MADNLTYQATPSPEITALAAMVSSLDGEFADGYRDGRDPTSPAPAGNRSPAYVHSWHVGRAEIDGRPIPAGVSRIAANRIAAINGAEGRP